MKKQPQKNMTTKRQKKIDRRITNQERTDKHLGELSNIVGGMQIGLDSLLRVLIASKLITVEEFQQAINDFGKQPEAEGNEAQGQVEVEDIKDPMEQEEVPTPAIELEKEGE